MTAFLPVPAGAFALSPSLPSSSPSLSRGPRMAFNPVGPPLSSYLSRIPLDRLNKAPVITLNAYPNADFNNITVRLADMARDEFAGETLRAGVVVDATPAPAPEKYEKYYPLSTLHEAPLISLEDGGTDNKRSLFIVQTTVPTSIANGKILLGDGVAPKPALYAAFDGPDLNKAPYPQIFANGDDSVAYSESATVALDYAGAELILKKYRK